MKNKFLFLSIVLGSFLLFPIENHSQGKDTSTAQSPNWNKLAREDIKALDLNAVFGRALSPAEKEHMEWVAKVARFLRGGAALTKKDDIKTLAKMSQEEVVNFFTSHPVFFDSVLDFNLYFLGFRLGPIKINGVYDSNLYYHRSAMQSAIESAKGGDYFSILDMYPQTPLLPFAPFQTYVLDYHSDFPDKETFLKLPSIEQKRVFLDFAIRKLNKISHDVERGSMSVEDACNTLSSNGLTSIYSYLGINYVFVQNNADFKAANTDFSATCYVTPIIAPTFKAPALFAKAYATLPPVMEKYDESVYKINVLGDMALVPKELDDQRMWFQQSFISQNLQNSSTNFNRKRSAYILSKFFCDDLTPINVEMPDEHTGGAHGSEPSCYACHYKLDPMAGFFRDYGFFFSDYSKEPTITFDDNATVDKVTYQKAWEADPKLGLKWNVGYVRSEKDPKLNSYGESLEDLMKIIRSSYEYKRCIVKRLFRFATDETQVMDAGYIEDLAKKFDQESEVNSSKAIKNLFHSVALSKTFAQLDRDPQTCYDLDPTTTSALPCAVRFVVEKNCTTCHDSTMSFSGLDMTTWKEVSPGLFGFHHVDDNGKELDRTVSLNMIMDRLTTNDPLKRMPKKMHMDPAHREQLFLWLNQELQK